MVNILRVRTTFTGITGAPYLNTAYFSLAGTTPADAAAAVSTFWGAVDSLLKSSVSWAVDAAVDELDATNGQLVGSTAVGSPGSGTGGDTSALLPFASQGLLRWVTSVYVGGRKLRGHWFIPGLTTSVNNQGHMDATLAGTFTTAGAALIADANSHFVIWSRKNGSFADVTSTSMWSEFATLRSRRD
jgi:hypothetical protein